MGENSETKEETKKHLLFVYGTLKEGFYNHDRYLGGSKSTSLGSAFTSNDYTLYIEALPFMVEESSDAPVEGELYEIDDATLAEIDDLEGHPYAYRRQKIRVTNVDGEEKLCYAYIYPNVFRFKPRKVKEYKYE